MVFTNNKKFLAENRKIVFKIANFTKKIIKFDLQNEKLKLIAKFRYSIKYKKFYLIDISFFSISVYKVPCHNFFFFKENMVLNKFGENLEKIPNSNGILKFFKKSF